MTAPVTFADWSDLFESLKSRGNENELIDAAYAGTFEWKSGTGEMWAEELANCITARIDLAKTHFDRDFSRAGGTESLITQALIGLKNDLKFALKLAHIPCIPAGQIPLYEDIVKNAAAQYASSLENSAKSDRSGKLSVLVRTARISDI